MIATLIERLEKDADISEEERRRRQNLLFSCWAEIHKRLTCVEKRLTRGGGGCNLSLYAEYLRLCYKIKLAYEGVGNAPEAPWENGVTELENFIGEVRADKSAE